MTHSTLKSRKTALGVAVLATTVAAGAALAQPGQGVPQGSAMECERWLDGRAEHNVPPVCRELAGELNQLRRATQAFYSADVARVAGWDTPLSECVESPLGGMGFHVGNLDEIGNASVSLQRPEAMLYAPTADGSMAFLGVEYIVPAALWDSLDPPQLMGQFFRFNPVQNIWALHVWTAKTNPEGIFAPWNPDVSCAFGDAFPFPAPEPVAEE